MSHYTSESDSDKYVKSGNHRRTHNRNDGYFYDLGPSRFHQTGPTDIVYTSDEDDDSEIDCFKSTERWHSGRHSPVPPPIPHFASETPVVYNTVVNNKFSDDEHSSHDRHYPAQRKPIIHNGHQDRSQFYTQHQNPNLGYPPNTSFINVSHQEMLDDQGTFEKYKVDSQKLEEALMHERHALEERIRLEKMAMKDRTDAATSSLELERLRREQEEQRDAARREKERLEAGELRLARQKLDEIERERERIEDERRRTESASLHCAQEELKAINLRREKELEEKRRKEEENLRRAKETLDELNRRKEAEEAEKRLAESLELRRRKEAEAAEREQKERKDIENRAIEQYKLKEADRIRLEAEERERIDREVKRGLEERLAASGLDSKTIASIVSGKKVDHECEHASDYKDYDSALTTYQDQTPTTSLLPEKSPNGSAPTYGSTLAYSVQGVLVMTKLANVIKKDIDLLLEVENSIITVTVAAHKRSHSKPRSPSLLMFLAGAR
ncbi:hypothetical protein CFO_g3244 [Ceratocystis platani]|uniref:Uncharacterized protein n=1 Tax=Ceratocystis fimbriata f. sp. platani TaxID=88771 RepID=A0A0F8BPD5_CERFI|nr:hypothetical protein CFO_g3244 [Ceratocystis platani]